jgi:hypothetical protein
MTKATIDGWWVCSGNGGTVHVVAETSGEAAEMFVAMAGVCESTEPAEFSVPRIFTLGPAVRLCAQWL